jgi:hypothetical protein
MATDSLLEYDRQEFRAQIGRMELLGTIKIHENQRDIGKKVHDTVLCNDCETLYTMVLAETQSGKTGSMMEVTKRAIEYCSTPPKNIFIITGLSSTEWKEQTQSRFPDIMKDNIFHNTDVEGKLEISLCGKQNVLIIIDEMHMAAKETQTIAKTFRKCNLDNPDFMFKNHVRIVEYSATPDGTLRDRLHLQERSKILMAEPGQGYVGPFQLLDRGSVFQAKDLSDKSNVAELHSHIMSSFGEPKYHIIRVFTQKKKKEQISLNFDELACIGGFDTKTYQQKDGDIVDLNDLLSTPPARHTFIFIKDMLRCAKTLVKTNIGVVYERLAKSVNDTAIIQGLLGRMTGYDVPDNISVFTNIETIERYRQLWEMDFDIEKVRWNSNTSKTRTYATDTWCEETALGTERERFEVSYKLFSDDERHTSLVEFTKRYMDWVPKKGSGTDIKELKNYTGEEIAGRKWGINRKTKRRIARGCDGVWVVLWLKEAFNT